MHRDTLPIQSGEINIPFYFISCPALSCRFGLAVEGIMRLVSRFCICVVVPSNTCQRKRPGPSRRNLSVTLWRKKNHRFPSTADLCLFVHSNGSKMKQSAPARTPHPNVSLRETLNCHCLPLSLFILGHFQLQSISAVRHNCFLTARAAVGTSDVADTVVPYLHPQDRGDKP